MKRVLVANRGEIALRIIRACHEEGLEAVAVFSDADRLSPHVRAADHAIPIGPPLPSESYLRIDKLLDAARASGSEAVHPGYGFLAERAAFAQAVSEAGLIFVGPSADAIRAMGDKTEARRRVAPTEGAPEPRAFVRSPPLIEAHAPFSAREQSWSRRPLQLACSAGFAICLQPKPDCL